MLDPETADKEALKKKARRISDLFIEEKGRHRWPGRRDPLAGLIQTLLSHNTTDPNAFAAYDRMLERYGMWKAVHRAPHAELAETIRVAGLNNQKAERIQKLLDFVHRTYGEYTADALEGMDFEQALEQFGHLPGIKHKTLAVVLCFDLGKDVFAVDTHVHRVCRRLGLVPEGATAVKTFQLMQPLVPEGRAYTFHIHLIRHGRETCKARKPACDQCFISHHCRYFQLEKA